MVAFLGFMQFISIIMNCIYELRKKSIAVFLWAVLVVMFGIPHMLSTLMGTYKYSKATMQEASIFVILFCIVYFITRYIFGKKHKNDREEITDLSTEPIEEMNKFMRILFIAMIVIIFTRCIIIIKQGGGLLNTSWSTMRETSGGYLSFTHIFTTLFFASSSCIILAIKLKNKKIAIIASILVIIDVLISRNRIEILPIFVSIIFLYIKNKNKVNLKSIFILGMLGIVAIYMIYALRAYRHIGTIENLVENYNVKTFNEKVLTYLEKDDGELSLRNYMYYFIENNNNFEDFGKGHTYIRMAFVLIPTGLSFGIKPTDFAISMGKAVLPNSVGFSMHPTLFGDVYANFGIYGFLWGAFWAIMVNCIDCIIKRRNTTLQLPFALNFGIAYVIEARGSVYNAFTWSVYGAIILIIAYIVFRWVNNSEKNI